MDWNAVLDAGDVDGGMINVVIEIPMGSHNKVEWNRKLKVFELDRFEPAIFPKPTNYGFIPQTLDEDGDELDALVITNDPIPMNVFSKCRILGVMEFEDDGEVDDKIICVPADDRDSGDAYKTLEDLQPQTLKKIAEHFTDYKNLKKPGSTIVKGFAGIERAKEIIKLAQKRWKDQ